MVTVPPPVFCSFTQSYLRLASVALVSSNPGSREAGPPVAVPLKLGLLLFQLAIVPQSPLPALVHSAGTRKSRTNSILPFAASRSIRKRVLDVGLVGSS